MISLLTFLSILPIPISNRENMPGAGAPTPLATPTPLSATDCGELTALSVIVTVAFRVPTEVSAGANVTEILQDFPTASEAPQLFVCPKSVAFAPVT